MPEPLRKALHGTTAVVVDVAVFAVTTAVCLAVLMAACSLLEAVIIWGLI